MKNIYEWKKKMISIDELEQFYQTGTYGRLHEIVTRLVEAGSLEPVRTSGGNGMDPPLFKRYRIKPVKKDMEEMRDYVRFSFPAGFDQEYYLNNPERLETEFEVVKQLVDWYHKHKAECVLPMSMNERSHRIWGVEKFLKTGGGQTILKNVGLSIDELNVYRTPEPFVYFSCVKVFNQNVLVIENKDTWYTMRKLMLEGQREFMGQRIDTVIYGSGHGIEGSLAEYEFTVEEYLKQPSQLLYWGDIDHEGLLIYDSIYCKYSDRLPVQAFQQAYIKMLELARGTKLQQAKEKQKRSMQRVLLSELSPHDIEISEIIDCGQYIPQEIVNYSILKGV